MRSEQVWRCKGLTAQAENIGEMAEALEAAAAQLRRMQEAGVTLDPEGATADDYALLVTADPDVAEEFGFEETPPWDSEDLWDDEAAAQRVMADG